MRIFICLVLFCSNLLCSQNHRDKVIYDSIKPLVYKTGSYNKVKNILSKLESKYGVEPELRYELLQKSFSNDISSFKKEMIFLIKNYGVNILYFNGNENYYNAIIYGKLAKWFKRIYLKNHFVWMKKNFLKQLDLKLLNEIRDRDQIYTKYSDEIYDSLQNLDSINKSILTQKRNKYLFSNLSDLHNFCQENENYPTAKNFAIIQNHFQVAMFHNYKSGSNFDKTWLLFYPYYKKAYLKNEMDYIVFKNYDNWSFIHNKNQLFGLLEIENVPEIFNPENLKFAPIRDVDFYKKIVLEFEWNSKL